MATATKNAPKAKKPVKADKAAVKANDKADKPKGKGKEKQQPVITDKRITGERVNPTVTAAKHHPKVRITQGTRGPRVWWGDIPMTQWVRDMVWAGFSKEQCRKFWKAVGITIGDATLSHQYGSGRGSIATNGEHNLHGECNPLSKESMAEAVKFAGGKPEENPGKFSAKALKERGE